MIFLFVILHLIYNTENQNIKNKLKVHCEHQMIKVKSNHYLCDFLYDGLLIKKNEEKKRSMSTELKI